jgi:DNA-binding Lrp family transcriptional regulator
MDELDTKLVRLLQSDGRTPIAALARSSGLTRAAATQRLDRLRASGAISITAVRNRAASRGRRAAHLAIKAHGDAQGLTTHLAADPSTAFLSRATGAFGVIAEIRSDSFLGINGVIDNIRHLEGVQAVSVLLLVEVVRDLIAPSGEPLFEPDATDHKLIGLLEEDGRRSYADLSKELELSPNATRSRLLRLTKGHVVRVATHVNRRVDDAELSVGIAIATGGRDADLIPELDAIPEVEFLCRVVGEFNVLLTVRTASRRQLTNIIDMLRSHHAVTDLNCWLHLDVVKDLDAPVEI